MVSNLDKIRKSLSIILDKTQNGEIEWYSIPDPDISLSIPKSPGTVFTEAYQTFDLGKELVIYEMKSQIRRISPSSSTGSMFSSDSDFGNIVWKTSINLDIAVDG